MADTPEALIDEFEAGFLTGDADAIADCYEDDAILVMAALGIVAEGKEAIRETWAGMAAIGQPIDFKISSRATFSTRSLSSRRAWSPVICRRSSTRSSSPARMTPEHWSCSGDPARG